MPSPSRGEVRHLRSAPVPASRDDPPSRPGPTRGAAERSCRTSPWEGLGAANEAGGGGPQARGRALPSSGMIEFWADSASSRGSIGKVGPGGS